MSKPTIRQYVVLGRNGKTSSLSPNTIISPGVEVFLVGTSTLHNIPPEDRTKPFTALGLRYGRNAHKRDHVVILKVIYRQAAEFFILPVLWKEKEGTPTPFIDPERTWTPSVDFLDYHSTRDSDAFHLHIHFKTKRRETRGGENYRYVEKDHSFTSDTSKRTPTCIPTHIDDLCQVLAGEINEREFMTRAASANISTKGVLEIPHFN